VLSNKGLEVKTLEEGDSIDPGLRIITIHAAKQAFNALRHRDGSYRFNTCLIDHGPLINA
jgi:hypothetical protein